MLRRHPWPLQNIWHAKYLELSAIYNPAVWMSSDWKIHRRWPTANERARNSGKLMTFGEPVTFLTYYMKLRMSITEQSKACICVYKAYPFFFLWPIVSVHLDKTLIYRLVSFIALWSCTETVILTFNRLESIEVQYLEKIPGMFSSKTLFSFRLKKKIHKHLGYHGGE